MDGISEATGSFNNSWLAGLTYSGFIDFRREHRPWQQISHILLTDHQLWVNMNKIKNWEKLNLSLSTEIEFSNNFVAKGFYVIPTLAAKWTF